MDDSLRLEHTVADDLLANLAWTQGLARRLVHGQEAAEELVQETWWRLLKNPPPRGAQKRAWIAAVMRRAQGDGYRSASRRKRREATFAKERTADLNQRHDEELGIHQDLVEHVKRLDPPLRRVILLRYFDDFSLAEIAESEGLKVSGVKERLSRAHERLRDRLKERPASPAGAWFLLQLPKPEPALSAALLVPTAFFAMKSLLAAVAVLALALVGFYVSDLSESTPGEDVIQADVEFATSEVLAGVASDASVSRVDLSEVRPLVEAPRAEVSRGDMDSEVDAAFVIRVVDEQGVAQGQVPVALMGADKNQRVYWQGTTDPQGSAHVPHSAVEKLRISKTDTSFMAALNIPCGPEGAKLFDLDGLDGTTVELVLVGPRGSLTVELRDGFGAPVTASASMRLTAIQSKGGVQKVSRIFETPVASFTFRGVDLNSRFLVGGAMLGVWEFAATEVNGPTAAGENKVVVVVVEASRPMVVGRVLGPDGAPFVGGERHVSGSIRSVTRPASNGILSASDGVDGRFACGLLDMSIGAFDRSSAKFVEGGLQEGEACRLEIRSTRGGENFFAELECSMPGPGQTLDLGDIIMRARPVRIGGVVLSSRGEPLVGVTVRLLPREPKDSLDFATLFFSYTASCDDEGRFEFYEVPEEGEFELEAVGSGFAPSRRVPAVDGQVDVVLRLEASLSLVGALIPPAGLNRSMIGVRASDNSELPLQGTPEMMLEQLREQTKRLRRSIVSRTAGEVALDWTFRIDGLSDQLYTLQITDRKGSRVLLEIDSLRAVGSTDQQDGRLAQIDLRGRVMPIRVEVQNKDGKPIQKGAAAIAGKRVSLERGYLETVVPAGNGEVVVGAPGMRYGRFELAALPDPIVLEPGIRVRLKAPDHWPAEVDRDKVRVTLNPSLAKVDRAKYPSNVIELKAFGSQESLELVVPAPGVYSVLWMGEGGAQDYLRIRNVFSTCSKNRIVVQDEAGVQEFDLSQS